MGVEKFVSEVPCTQFNFYDLQMVIGGGEGSISCELGELIVLDEDEDPDTVPLCSINPNIEWQNKSFGWVLRKVEEIKNCVGSYCDGFEEQFRALLIANEAGQPAISYQKREGVEKVGVYYQL